MRRTRASGGCQAAPQPIRLLFAACASICAAFGAFDCIQVCWQQA